MVTASILERAIAPVEAPLRATGPQGRTFSFDGAGEARPVPGPASHRCPEMPRDYLLQSRRALSGAAPWTLLEVQWTGEHELDCIEPAAFGLRFCPFCGEELPC